MRLCRFDSERGLVQALRDRVVRLTVTGDVLATVDVPGSLKA